MLALALVPSLGRLVQGSAMRLHASQVHGHDCAEMTQPPAGGGNGGHTLPADGDCAYCPILASLSLPAVQVFAIPALSWPRYWNDIGTQGRPREVAATGLGARGPPVHG